MTIFGILGIADTERAYVQHLGQRLVFDAAQQYLMEQQAELDLVIRGTSVACFAGASA